MKAAISYLRQLAKVLLLIFLLQVALGKDDSPVLRRRYVCVHVSVGAATLTLVTITIINEFIVLKQFLYTGEKKRLYQSIRWHGKSSVLIIFGVPVLILICCVFFFLLFC